MHEDGHVVVTKPASVSVRAAEDFVHARRAWLEGAVAQSRASAEKPRTKIVRPRKGSTAYKSLVAQARALAHTRLAHFNSVYGFTYGTITIRDQKTRWGSCSKTWGVGMRRGLPRVGMRKAHQPHDEETEAGADSFVGDDCSTLSSARCCCG